jgi:23S rRNA pseudouridine2605 synthase
VKTRIQKLLASAGVASRRAIEQLVAEGRVAVNGQVRTDLPILVDPSEDRIEVDGELVRFPGQKDEPRVYLLMNKPRGVYCTNVAQGEQKRLIDLLPPKFPYRVFPVGRLDAESRGLILLTNDGELTQRLTHPRYGVAKTYHAAVDGVLDPKALQTLRKGVWLADPGKGGFKTGPSRIHVLRKTRERTLLEITLHEGRNRQIRRMLAAIGHKVRDLTRVRMGPLTIEGVPPGAFRQLSTKEVRKLRELAFRTPDQPVRPELDPASGPAKSAREAPKSPFKGRPTRSGRGGPR